VGRKIYPLNKTKYWYCYDIDGLARLYNVHPKTISKWQNEGLEAIDSRKPALFYGHVVKKFIGQMNELNKCKINFENFFCFKCQEGKSPLKKQIQILPIDQKFLRVKAICQTCKNVMHKPYKLDDLSQLRRIFTTVQLLELYDSAIPLVNTPFFDQDQTTKKEPENRPIQTDLFL